MSFYKFIDVTELYLLACVLYAIRTGKLINISFIHCEVGQKLWVSLFDTFNLAWVTPPTWSVSLTQILVVLELR